MEPIKRVRPKTEKQIWWIQAVVVVVDPYRRYMIAVIANATSITINNYAIDSYLKAIW